METTADLAALSPSALTQRLYDLRREERRMLVEFLQYLGEVDRRGVHLEAGSSSLFSFLTDHLGFTRSSAFRRSTAARLLRDHPLVAEYLADGRLCLTTLVELRTVLPTCESLRQLLDRAAGKTEDEVKALVVALAPRPVPSDLIRKLPTPVPLALALTAAPPAQVSAGPAQIRRPDPPRVQPVTEDRHVVRFTVGADFVASLDQVKAAFSHKIPDGNLEEVFAECMKLALAECAKRRRGAGRPPRPPAKQPAGSSRYVPAAVRDEVWRRDESRCAFVGDTGKRCDSNHQLEVHHREPFARGGAPTADNLALFCKRHNLHAARKDFGAEHIARAVGAVKVARPTSASIVRARGGGSPGQR